MDGETFNHWDFIFGAGGVALLGISWKAIEFFITRRDKKKQLFTKKQKNIEELFHDLLASAIGLQELIEEFVLDRNIDRIMILKLENGGGVPQLGMDQHASILNEAIHPSHQTTDKLPPLKQDYQFFTIDVSYQRLMMNMIMSKYYKIQTTDMEDSILKTVYTSCEVVESIHIPVANIPAIDSDVGKGFMVYLSIQQLSEIPDDDIFKAECIVLSDKIRNIFQKFYIDRITYLK